MIRFAKIYCKKILISYNKIGNGYGYFFLYGVVRIIGNKNSKPYSREIKQKQTTDTNKM